MSIWIIVMKSGPVWLSVSQICPVNTSCQYRTLITGLKAEISWVNRLSEHNICVPLSSSQALKSTKAGLGAENVLQMFSSSPKKEEKQDSFRREMEWIQNIIQYCIHCMSSSYFTSKSNGFFYNNKACFKDPYDCLHCDILSTFSRLLIIAIQ